MNICEKIENLTWKQTLSSVNENEKYIGFFTVLFLTIKRIGFKRINI